MLFTEMIDFFTYLPLLIDVCKYKIIYFTFSYLSINKQGNSGKDQILLYWYHMDRLMTYTLPINIGFISMNRRLIPMVNVL